MYSLLRKSLALVFCGSLFYALSVYGVSDVNSGAVYRDKPIPFAQYQKSNLLSPDALLIQSQDKLEKSPAKAESLALLAFKLNPSSGRAASILLELYDTGKDTEKADEVATFSRRLWPAHTLSRSRLADYWLKRQILDRVLVEWNVLLIRNPSQRSIFYPFLTEILLNTEVSFLMQQFIEKPPAWWDSYFAYLSRELSVSQLREVYQSRVVSSSAVSVIERRYYVSRLLKVKAWGEARKEWFLGLSDAQKQYDGLVFDGGFESGVLNQGFGWKYNMRTKNPKIKTDITYGVKGRKALHIYLNKKDAINFKHISQQLMLEAGSYELAMRFRTDTLKASEGLSWRIRCVEGGTQVLAESESFIGSNPWSTSRASFDVPNSCKVQVLRLEAASRYKHEWFFDGSLWFDEISISKKQEEQ